MRGLRGLQIGLHGVFTVDPRIAEYSDGSIPPPSGPPNPAFTIPGDTLLQKIFGGGKMTYEQGLAQFILRRTQTIAGTNLAATNPGQIIGFPPNAFLPSGQLRIVKDPSIDMPKSGQPYNKEGIEGKAFVPVVLPPITTSVVVVQFTVPPRKNGSIEFIANQFIGGGWTEGTGQVIWQIVADGVPVQGYESIVNSLGSTSAPGPLGRSPILVTQNQVIQLIAINAGIFVPAGQPLQGLLRGHFYPVEQTDPNQW